MFSAVMFDYDGTLSDSIGQLYAFYCHLCDSHGKTKPFSNPEEFCAWFAEPYSAVYERLGFDWETQAAMLQGEFRAFREVEPPRIADGVVELLAFFEARRIPIAIASNGFEDQIRTELTSHGLITRFESIRGVRGTTDPIKPAPDLLLDAARQAGVDPQQTLYIGDASSDILAARNAGMHGAGITTGLHTRKQLQEQAPLAVFDHPSEIIGFLQK